MKRIIFALLIIAPSIAGAQSFLPYDTGRPVLQDKLVQVVDSLKAAGQALSCKRRSVLPIETARITPI